jgi:hypothetical protein
VFPARKLLVRTVLADFVIVFAAAFGNPLLKLSHGFRNPFHNSTSGFQHPSKAIGTEVRTSAAARKTCIAGESFHSSNIEISQDY